MASTYYHDYSIFITDADLCAQYQAAFPDGILGVPDTIAITYSAPINPAPPTFGEGQCIWTGSLETILPTSVASAAIPAGSVYAPDSSTGLQTQSGAPGGTVYWRGSFLRRAVPGPVTKEALQTHRWMVGFERPNVGEGESGGTVTQRASRDASRTLEGLGLALRGPANETVPMTLPTAGTGAPTKYSWERIYVRLRNYPAAATMLWGCKGTIEAGTAALIQVTPSGQLVIYNKGNQAYPGTTISGATGGQLPLNQWVKLDIIVSFVVGSSGGSGDGSLFLFVNGALSASMRGAGPGVAAVGGAGGLLNTLQNHSQSLVGNEDATANTLDIDYDDWTNKTQPQLFTGDDWVNGTHIQPLRIEGFGPGHSGSWTGAFQTLDGVPVNGQVDSVDSSTANVSIEVTTDYQDRQIGCSGIVISLFSKTASGTVENIGYATNGGGFTMSAVTVSSATWAVPSPSSGTPSVMYTAGGNKTPPVLTSLNLKYTRDAIASARAIQALQASAEYVGVWGPEDPPNLANPSEFPPRQGPHNSPYADNLFGQTAFPRPLGLIEVMSGTYTGNGTGQDVVTSMPAHWIWIRPLSLGTGGGRWWSSCLAGHDPLIETPNKGNLVRGFQSNNTAGPSGYKFRVSGSNANSNANGVTYQWCAFSDRSMRFCLNGAYLKLAATASFTHNLFDGSFIPTAGFLLPELGSSAATTGMYFKGPGSAANGASLMDSAEAATVCAFGTGTITPKTIINLASAQTAYSLWRSTDGDGVTGAVAITSYVGDGSGARNIALALGGRSPLFALVQPNNGVAYQRDPSHSGSNSNAINSSAAAPSTTAITAGQANQITVGATLNAGGVTYSVFVLSGTVTAGWTPNPTEPIVPVDSQPPTTPFAPSSSNGWWTSSILFTGAATLSTFPPTNPRDARDWQKVNIFATGNAGFYAGFPPPGVMVNNFFIYAGNDYQVGGGQPTIRIFDGLSDRLMITIPDVAGVKAIAIIAMISVNGIIYLTTLDSGTSASDYAGRVFSFNPDTLTLTQIGTQFTTGEVPYALCWHMGRLFMGTNKGSGAAAKVYWFRVGLDTAWTTDRTLTTDGVGGALSMASYQGKLYVGCNATAAMGTNKIVVRDSLGAWSTSYTAVVAGTFRASNGFPAMVVFNDKLYASYWNPDTTPDGYVKRFDGTSWTTVYTGSGSTLRPFSGLFVVKNTLFIVGGGSGLSACLLSSPDGNTWTDLTSFLSGPTTTVTAMPIIAQIGA